MTPLILRLDVWTHSLSNQVDLLCFEWHHFVGHAADDGLSSLFYQCVEVVWLSIGKHELVAVAVGAAMTAVLALGLGDGAVGVRHIGCDDQWRSNRVLPRLAMRFCV